MQFNRNVTATLQFGAFNKIISSPYKIDFDITKSTGGTYESGNITISGLSSYDIAILASFYEYNKAVLLPNTVTLSAGYKLGVQGLIFVGAATDAKPSLDTSDKFISLEVTSAYYSNELNAVSVQYEVTTLSMISAEIASKLGVALKFTAIDKQIKNYAFQGQIFAQIESLRNTYRDILFYISNNTLCVESANLPGAAVPIICSVYTGMVGTPEPTYLGCNVKMLLNPLAEPGALVNVVSQRLPILTGTYRAMNVRHTGSSRDSYFYTEIECTKELGI